MFRKICSVLVVLLTLGGCATSGPFNGLDPDPMKGMIVIRGDGKPLTQSQKQMVLIVAQEAAKNVRTQLSSPLESGAAYGAASLVSSQTAGLFFTVDGIAAVSGLNGAVGVIGGFASYSYAAVYAITDAADFYLQYRTEKKIPGYEDMEGIRLFPAFVRSRNSEESFSPAQRR